MPEKATFPFNDYTLTIANDGETYHPVATNHFVVTITLPNTLKDYAHAATPEVAKVFDAAAATNLQLSLKIANDTIAEPNLGQSKLTYKKGNLEISFPGTINATTTQARFHVFVKKSAYDILYAWKMASGNHMTGEVGDPADYWATVQVDVTTGNKGTHIGYWKFHNVWLSSLEGVTFTNGADEVKTCNVTMEIFRPEWHSAQW